MTADEGRRPMTSNITVLDPARPRLARILHALSFRRISAIYVLIAVCLYFSITIPETFLAASTWRSLLDSQAIIALVAVGLVIPLAAGAFNLAIGAQVGAASIMVGWALVPLGWPVPAAIALVLVVGALIGLLMGLLVVRLHIDSFIATMGVSSLLMALITMISGGRQILGMPEGFAAFGTSQLLGITYPVITMLLVCVVVWYVLERTPVGRKIYATGGGAEAARLAGVATNRVIVGALVAGGVVAAIAGVLITSRLANADPTIGPGYLLPAFTAAFLGSTQFKPGRFNVWGTVVSVYVLAVGIKGLQLSGAPVWISDAFNGAALLLAVGLAVAEQRKRGGRVSLRKRSKSVATSTK